MDAGPLFVLKWCDGAPFLTRSPSLKLPVVVAPCIDDTGGYPEGSESPPVLATLLAMESTISELLGHAVVQVAQHNLVAVA